MIEYLDGTVFNSPAKTLVNTVNCFGTMGAGIALEFKLRYPEMFEEYVELCEKKQMLVGIPKIYEVSEDLWIMNFATKNHWRNPSKIEWIEQGLDYFVKNYKKRNIDSIAFPKLGTANGGLEWQEIKLIMEKYLSDLEIPVYICLNEKIEAEGIEKKMIDDLNNIDLVNICKEIGITKKAATKIEEGKEIQRFWHISKIKGITSKSYESVYKYFYERSNKHSDKEKIAKVYSEQLTLNIEL